MKDTDDELMISIESASRNFIQNMAKEASGI